MVRLSNARVNAPRSFFILVDRMSDRPIRLIEVRRGIADWDALRARFCGRSEMKLEFGEMEVAVLPSPGAFEWKRVVGEHFETHGANAACGDRRGDRVDILVWARAGGNNGPIWLNG
jgi:hypothetical protein